MNEERESSDVQAVQLRQKLLDALPASLTNVTNVMVRQWPSAVVKVVVRVYDEARRGRG